MTTTDPAIQEHMTLEEIMEVIDAIITINEESIDREAARQVKIYSKIQRLYMWNTRKLEKMTTEADQVKMFRQRYYGGKLSSEHYKKEPLREAILKTDIDQYVKIDSVYLEAKSRLAEQERIVKYIEDSKKMLSERGYLLNTALSFQKMNMGM